VVLIPFADEELFLMKEREMMEKGFVLTQVEATRNKTKFSYPSFSVQKEGAPKSGLVSKLTSMKDLAYDKSVKQINDDYETVGQRSFSSALRAGVKIPSVDFPSLKWLSANELTVSLKYVQKVPFE
jgi:hypothetical protein